MCHSWIRWRRGTGAERFVIEQEVNLPFGAIETSGTFTPFGVDGASPVKSSRLVVMILFLMKVYL